MAKRKKKPRRPSRAHWMDGVSDTLRPPPRRSLSQWADEHFVLSAESAAEPGRWRTLPYQRGILDAITDPAIMHVTVMKSARIGYTKCINAAIAYHIMHDPSSMMVVQPTVEDAEGYSKEEIAPMLRDMPELSCIVDDDHGPRTSEQTILQKSYPGGVLSMVGANSGRGFRRVSRRIVIFDEVDAYPQSSGLDGDPIKLGTKRAEYFWNRKIIAGSTPLIAGASRIEEMFEAGDRRRYYVPCPHCKRMDYLRFNVQKGGQDDLDDKDSGHMMRWPEGQPEIACFVCRECGCEIDESHKVAMLNAGEWRAEEPCAGHASFHIWAAYSLSPNATWGQIAREFLEATKGPTANANKLKTFVNTTLGQTWIEKGEAPEWERLYDKRETYPIGTVPDGVVALTCGVDVQKNRFVYEVVGWGRNKETWSVEAGELFGDTANEATWVQLDELLAKEFPSSSGSMQIAKLAIDSGYSANMVYAWARRYSMTRVMAVKGVGGLRAIVGAPSSVDVNEGGKMIRRACRLWPVGGDIVKSELYGWLRLRIVDGVTPAGYCHFPQYGEEFFKQLTAEHLVSSVNRKTRKESYRWETLPNRDNHFLDCRVYARAAAVVLGIDRLPRSEASAAPIAPAKVQATSVEASPERRRDDTDLRPKGSFWNRGGGRSSWMSRRR